MQRLAPVTLALAFVRIEMDGEGQAHVEGPPVTVEATVEGPPVTVEATATLDATGDVKVEGTPGDGAEVKVDWAAKHYAWYTEDPAEFHTSEDWPLERGDREALDEILALVRGASSWSTNAQNSPQAKYRELPWHSHDEADAWDGPRGKRVFMNLRLYDTSEDVALARHMLYFHGLGILMATGSTLAASTSLEELVSAFEASERFQQIFTKLLSLSLNGLRNLHTYDHSETERLIRNSADAKGVSYYTGRGVGANQAMQCLACRQWLEAQAPYLDVATAKAASATFLATFQGSLSKHGLEHFDEYKTNQYVWAIAGIPDEHWAEREAERCSGGALTGGGQVMQGKFTWQDRSGPAWPARVAGRTGPEHFVSRDGVGLGAEADESIDPDLCARLIAALADPSRADYAAAAQAYLAPLLKPHRAAMGRHARAIWAAEIAEWWLYGKEVDQKLE